MQISLESDFERFAQKIKEHTNTNIQKRHNEAEAYALEKRERAVKEVDAWLEQEQFAWKKEYQERKEQGFAEIKNNLNKQWNSFVHEREKELREQLRQKIEEIFPSLAESFIIEVSRRYDKGTFLLPKRYVSLIKEKAFISIENQQEHIIFKNENLYIEYSVERIMDELDNEISSVMDLKGRTWQV